MIDETRHYQPDPLLAPYVEQTFQKYADGATMTDLRDWLKAHNIKNSMGGEMSYNTIQRMLSNRRYIGELRLRDVVARFESIDSGCSNSPHVVKMST